MDELLRYFTLNEIAAHTNISRRNLSYFRRKGITQYAYQLALELLAERKKLVRD